MAIPFADILQDGDLPPVSSLGVYAHFNNIVFYAPLTRSVYALKGLIWQIKGIQNFPGYSRRYRISDSEF
jgi:hypothetical protein